MTRRPLPLSLLASLVAISGCGESNERDRAPTAKPDVNALVAELTGAGPQGQVSSRQAAATGVRQARIAARYAQRLPAGGCKRSLETLRGAYERYAQISTSGASPEELAASAGGVPTSLEGVQRACA